MDEFMYVTVFVIKNSDIVHLFIPEWLCVLSQECDTNSTYIVANQI